MNASPAISVAANLALVPATDFEARVVRYQEGYRVGGAPVARDLREIVNPASRRHPEQRAAAETLRGRYAARVVGSVFAGSAALLGAGLALGGSVLGLGLWVTGAVAAMPGLPLAMIGATSRADRLVSERHPALRRLNIPVDVANAYQDFREARRHLYEMDAQPSALTEVEVQSQDMDRLVEQMAVLVDREEHAGALGVRVRDRVVHIAAEVRVLADLEQERINVAALLSPDVEAIITKQGTGLRQEALASAELSAGLRELLDPSQPPALTTLADPATPAPAPDEDQPEG